jgi:hypothetical protein
MSKSYKLKRTYIGKYKNEAVKRNAKTENGFITILFLMVMDYQFNFYIFKTFFKYLVF